MEVINRTPYAMERVVVFDRGGRETLLLIVKGTFVFGPQSSAVADEPAPMVEADAYYGDPATTSIRLPGDFMPPRPATGVTLAGHAVCPDGRIGKMTVGLKVGPLQQAATVFGDRAGFDAVNRPEPFARMALTWENAFGGIDDSPDKDKHHDALAENPVGKGFLAAKTRRSPGEVALPNVEHPVQQLKKPFERVPPVGFGPVPPFWEQRRRWAGTYDDAWRTERAPFPPDDFDDRFYQAAPAPLTADGYLAGNEECVVLGMTDEGRLDFRLDAPAPTLGVRFARKGTRLQPVLEGIHFDTDQRRYFVTWKAALDVQGRVEELRNVEARIL